MINAQLAAFHRTITLTERSEHAVFHQKCFKDLGKAINPRTNISPPESILPAYIERYTVGEGDLEPTPSPLPTKFAIQAIRVIDTKRSMSGINSASGPDGMTAKALKSFSPPVWTCLFNKVLSLKLIPNQWRHISATFLDKGNDKPRDSPSRWRPLFIAAQAL
ncbi:hypothetical protein ADUPG1_002043, partial [Aduncisulcus paluster]